MLNLNLNLIIFVMMNVNIIKKVIINIVWIHVKVIIIIL